MFSVRLTQASYAYGLYIETSKMPAKSAVETTCIK